jgi:hypothetical protein
VRGWASDNQDTCDVSFLQNSPGETDNREEAGQGNRRKEPHTTANARTSKVDAQTTYKDTQQLLLPDSHAAVARREAIVRSRLSSVKKMGSQRCDTTKSRVLHIVE